MNFIRGVLAGTFFACIGWALIVLAGFVVWAVIS